MDMSLLFGIMGSVFGGFDIGDMGQKLIKYDSLHKEYGTIAEDILKELEEDDYRFDTFFVEYLMDYDLWCINFNKERNPNVKEALMKIYNNIIMKKEHTTYDLHFCINFERYFMLEIKTNMQKSCCVANTECQTDTKGPVEE